MKKSKKPTGKPCGATVNGQSCALELGHASAGHSTAGPGRRPAQHMTWVVLDDGRIHVTTFNNGKRMGDWYEASPTADAEVVAIMESEQRADESYSTVEVDGETILQVETPKISKIYTKAEREKLEEIAATEPSALKTDAEPVPADEQRALAKLDQATRMLAEVRDVPSAKSAMDLASAAEHYARKAKLGQDAVNYAAGVKLDAERMLGQYLKQRNLSAGRPANDDEKESLPELLNLPRSAALKLSSEAQRLATLPEETFAKVKTGEIKPMVALRDQRRAELGDRIRALPVGKFRVVYADPPWKYGDERTGSATAIGGDGSRADSSAADKYPTMPTSAICGFADENGRHVSDLAASDAVLFMWATFPLLEDALAVVKAWGFQYKTAFVWDKERSNVGNYHDARAELLLIGIRGSCPIEIDWRPKQVHSIARGKHSAKPEAWRALIDEMYPSGPRVELFRRGEAPKGWVVWGNEAKVAA